MAANGEMKLESSADRNDGIGRKLRQRRQIKGRSLQQVAEQAEISVGLLSQIERGLTMPSLRSLRQICTALDMPVGWLFDVPTTEHDHVVVRASGRRTLDLGPKGLRKELMSPDAVSGIQMMRMTIRPGGGLDKAMRNEVGAKCGTVLSGVLALELAGTLYTIQAGDSFAFEATTLHRYWCVGEEPVDFLWIVAPAVY